MARETTAGALHRRAFLAGLVGAVGTLACGSGEPEEARRRPEPGEAPSAGTGPEPHAALPRDALLPDDPEALALLLRVADAVVPGGPDHPAASGIADFRGRLTAWVSRSPRRVRVWQHGFPALARALRAEGTGPAPAPPALRAQLATWHRDFRAGRRDPAAVFFEQLRRDVLRVYYASPEGWRSLGYGGPPHLDAPPGAAPA